VGVLLHANYRLLAASGQKIVMPAPVDKDTPHAPWWWDHLAQQAADFRRSGFSAVLLPPVCKSQSGSAPGADGYGLYDNYDIGSKNQVFNIPTRYGDHERLRRMIGIMHACGLDVYADVVMHQYDGGNNGAYRYVGADGKTLNGRFPKHPSCFVGALPRVAVDPVADPQGNFEFGDMASYMNSTPQHYMLNGAIDAADWLTRTLDVQGYRIDDVKGMAVQAVRQVLDAKSMANRFAVGEYFDGNPASLHWWVWNSGMAGRCNVFDFTLHWTIQAMCNNNSNWWMGGLQGAGYIAVDPMNAVTFVDNPDTDLSAGENVIWNKLLGYALMLTAEGYPSVYYKDYSPDPGCYGLKPPIDNLIWIHENLAFGSSATRWGNDRQVYVFERLGYPGLLVGLNNDQWNSYTRNVQTNFGAHVKLHDYTGHQGDVWTDEHGMVTITLPRNENGASYVCYSRIGYAQGFAINRRTTTQTFFGAADLDTSPAANGLKVQAGRVWCQQGTTLEAEFSPDTGGWQPDAEILVEILDPQNRVLASQTFRANQKGGALKLGVKESGWHALQVTGHGLPAGGAAYEMAVTYVGTEGLQS
jgi:alpha-amylase